ARGPGWPPRGRRRSARKGFRDQRFSARTTLSSGKLRTVVRIGLTMAARCNRNEDEMSATARLNLPYIAPLQAQKQVSYNDAMAALDQLVQPVVLSRSLG